MTNTLDTLSTQGPLAGAESVTCNTTPKSGTCDWCRLFSDKLVLRRDFEDDECVRLYDMCQSCVAKEDERLLERRERALEDREQLSVTRRRLGIT